MDLNLDKDTGNIKSLEDRLWLAANLISLEEHAYSSYLRTSDYKYIRMMEIYRQQRIIVFNDLLGIDAPNCEAELWCMFKHALGGAMRAYESGNRETGTNIDLSSKYFSISKILIEQAFEILENIKSVKTLKETSKYKIETESKESKIVDTPNIHKEKHGLLYYLKCCLE